MNWMNDYPIKILGYMTAEEAFIKELKLIEKASLNIQGSYITQFTLVFKSG